MTENVEVALKLVLSLAAIAFFVALPRLRRAGTLLGILAAVSVAAWFNLGAFHPGRTFPHYWEQFHYFLGSKYFPEVGYDGLYVASMGAEMRAFPGRPYQPFLRDLRSNEVTHTMNLEAHGLEVYRRFSPQRWAEFQRDNAFFVRLDAEYLQKIRGDHGFNPSPAWVAVARLFAARASASQWTFTALGALDVLLLGLAFVSIWRAFGRETALSALVVFALGYPWRFFWTGGGLLRQDWLVALVLAACALRRQRHFAAGAFLAYATMVRVFPLLLWAGPLAFAAFQIFGRGVDPRARRGAMRWVSRMILGFVVTCAALVAAGSAVGRGPSAWIEFARNLEKHSASWLTNNVGLKNVVLYDGVTYRRELLQPAAPEPWIEWQRHMNQRRHEPWAVGTLGAAILGLLALVVWRARDEARRSHGPPDETVLTLGVPVVFALTTLTCYYWSLLLLFVVTPRPRGPAAGVLTLSALVAATQFLSPAFELRYGLMSWLLLAFFVAWLGWRERFRPAGGPGGTESPPLRGSNFRPPRLV